MENRSFFVTNFQKDVVIFRKQSVRIKGLTDVFDIEVLGGQI